MDWDTEKRQSLLARLNEISETLQFQDTASLDQDTVLDLEVEEEGVLMEYAELLPHTKITRCPYCDSEVAVAIDTQGFDGPWWWTTCPVDLPQHRSCRHFLLFQGAVNLQERLPEEATESVMLGPGAPFVIDRLMSKHTVKCVVSSVDMATDHRIFLMSYFSEEALPPIELHQEFRHEKYPLVNEDGDIEFSESKHDPWNFDLKPFFESEQLLWIAPEDSTLTLQSGLENPYLELEGTRMNQVLEFGEVDLYEAPYGQEDTKFEPH